jgi:hypothetical protein
MAHPEEHSGIDLCKIAHANFPGPLSTQFGEYFSGERVKLNERVMEITTLLVLPQNECLAPGVN